MTSKTDLEVLLMGARAAIRQSLCPACKRSGYDPSQECRACKDRTTMCDGLLEFDAGLPIETIALPWIRTRDRLPAEGASVIYHFKTCGTFIGKYHGMTDAGAQFGGREGFLTGDVTHWMPLIPPFVDRCQCGEQDWPDNCREIRDSRGTPHFADQPCTDEKAEERHCRECGMLITHAPGCSQVQGKAE